MAKATAAHPKQSLEDQAWGTSPKVTKPVKKTPAKAKKPGTEEKATVTLQKNTLPLPKPVDLSKAGKAKPKHATEPAITDESHAPGVPRDFGSDAESKAYLQDIDNAQGDVKNLLSQLMKKKYDKLPSGLSGINALQADIEKALANENIPGEDREALKTKIQERDTAMYMLGASLVAQKKDYQAGMYLKFLAKNAQPGTPMREAAQQQLAQIGQ